MTVQLFINGRSVTITARRPNDVTFAALVLTFDGYLQESQSVMYAYEETARQFGCTIDTVRNYVRKSRTKKL
jgi:hypothetical protein